MRQCPKESRNLKRIGVLNPVHQIKRQNWYRVAFRGAWIRKTIKLHFCTWIYISISLHHSGKKIWKVIRSPSSKEHDKTGHLKQSVKWYYLQCMGLHLDPHLLMQRLKNPMYVWIGYAQLCVSHKSPKSIFLTWHVTIIGYGALVEVFSSSHPR